MIETVPQLTTIESILMLTIFILPLFSAVAAFLFKNFLKRGVFYLSCFNLYVSFTISLYIFFLK